MRRLDLKLVRGIPEGAYKGFFNEIAFVRKLLTKRPDNVRIITNILDI